jgi:hypothetical protein
VKRFGTKIATDAQAGKLDSVIKKAKAGHLAGKATAFPRRSAILKKRGNLTVISTGGRKFNAVQVVSKMRDERIHAQTSPAS